MSLSKCPECGTSVSPLDTACPTSGRPDPVKPRRTKFEQLTAAWIVLLIGLTGIGIGLYLFQDHLAENQYAGGNLAILGLGVVMLGIGTIVHISRRKDW